MQPVPAHKKGIYRTAHLFSTYLSLCSHLKGMMKSENWPRCQENGSRGLKLKIFPVGNLNKQRKQIHLLFYFCSLDSWKPLIPLNSQPSSESSTQTWLHKIWNVLHTEEKHGGKKNKLLGTNTKSPNPLTFLSLSSKEEHKATLFPCISPWIDYCKCLLNCDVLENTEVLLAPCFLLCGVCPLLIAGELQHCYMARGSRALWEKKKKKNCWQKLHQSKLYT